MENNFYLGVVMHSKKRSCNNYTEKVVLYSDDNIFYIDLVNGNIYSTDVTNKDYVLIDTLVSTDIKEYKTDYLFLLNKFKSNKDIYKRKKFYLKKYINKH
ncbi:MAG: hypothetical protein IJZ46_03040 [Bacilli bacterium]|nr:hypothetical protein [Bacilli bacterium]